MKTLKIFVASMTIMALFLTSCSNDNNPTVGSEDKVALTLGTLLNDLVTTRAESKQAISELIECSEDAPVYIEIILSRDGSPVVGSVEAPFRIDLVEGQIYTEDIPEMELDPAMYSLDYLTVHNAGGDVIWIAPQTDSPLGEFVEMGLPMDIDLRAGVKKYVDVPVLCYDNRDVNEYGYLFFELDTNEAIKFCIFGNYCPPNEPGRHYPASYSVSIWSGTDSSGTPLYTDVPNVTDYYDNGDYYAEPLCFALPDTEGLDEYYFEITLLSSEEYGEVEETIIRTGVINDDIVRTFFDGDNNLDYYHFREGEGCGDDSPPIFEDPDSTADYYKTCAYPINGTTSVALAFFEVEDNVLKATVLAANVTPNEEHMQHLHGFDGAENSICPPDSADTNDDGLISLAEGVPFYGGVQLALTNEDDSYPEADAFGLYMYQRTFDLTGMTLPEWEDMTVVVHGRNVNGSYDATLPVACGQVNNLQP